MSAPARSVRLEVRRRSWTYEKLDAYQKALLASGQSGLLLTELEPVITLGKRAQPSELLLSKEEYARKGIALYPTDRGGLATYHGPGQWVLFPHFSVEFLTGQRVGVRTLVEGLLEAAQSAAAELGVLTEIRSGCETGLWAQGPSGTGLGGRFGKLASVGIRIRNGIVMHGLSLNVLQTPESFFGIHPCGLGGASLAYLFQLYLAQRASSQLAAIPPWTEDEFFEAVGQALVGSVAAKFNLEVRLDT